MEQSSLWTHQSISPQFSELCNALYEREILVLAQQSMELVMLQARLKSTPYYVKLCADKLLQMASNSPLQLDLQNAMWNAKQAGQLPLNNQSPDDIYQWYNDVNLVLGLVVPVAYQQQIFLDSIDRIDIHGKRIRTNAYGWFNYQNCELPTMTLIAQQPCLLKPNKRVMTAACAGHQWQGQKKLTAHPLSMRDLLLSCQLNWRNFKRLTS